MKKGDWVDTPRFLKVEIEEVFENISQACNAGFKEPTHYQSEEYEVLGKSLDMYHMVFAAVKKQRNY